MTQLLTAWRVLEEAASRVSFLTEMAEDELLQLPPSSDLPSIVEVYEQTDRLALRFKQVEEAFERLQKELIASDELSELLRLLWKEGKLDSQPVCLVTGEQLPRKA